MKIQLYLLRITLWCQCYPILRCTWVMMTINSTNSFVIFYIILSMFWFMFILMFSQILIIYHKLKWVVFKQETNLSSQYSNWLSSFFFLCIFQIFSNSLSFYITFLFGPHYGKQALQRGNHAIRTPRTSKEDLLYAFEISSLFLPF